MGFLKGFFYKQHTVEKSVIKRVNSDIHGHNGKKKNTLEMCLRRWMHFHFLHHVEKRSYVISYVEEPLVHCEDRLMQKKLLETMKTFFPRQPPFFSAVSAVTEI